MKKIKQPAQIHPEHFNLKYPIGTAVKYFPIMGIDKFIETKTRSEAWEMGGTTVVMIEGKSGGCAVSHMRFEQPTQQGMEE